MKSTEDINPFNNIDFEPLDERQSALEEIATQVLLVELFNAKKAEVFENVVFEGKRRYYVEDLSKRDYTLENTTPYQLDILGHAIEEHSWGLLLCRIADLLLNLFPEFKEKILVFRCPWSKTKMFTLESKTNHKPISDGLYINCNHTALHACWFLQDLLDFFGVEKSKVSFLIHRPSSAEPPEVRDYIEKRFKRNFAEFLRIRYNKTDDYANKVINIAEKYFNSMLLSVSKSYTNIFLFDDNATLSYYIKKIREKIFVSLKFDVKSKKVLNKYLDYVVEFYKII